jgi:hypothetical protein
MNLNTTYYYRGYATNAGGTAYSPDGTFTTLSVTIPVVTTQAASSILMNGVTANGNITDFGNEPNNIRGFVYDSVTHALPGNVAPNSSLYPNKVEQTGSFSNGAFTGSITGLTYSSTYYYRAYSHNSIGYSYGPEVSFTTAAFPLLTQSAYKMFGNADSADIGATLTSQDTAISLSSTRQNFRVRILMHVEGSALPVGAANFKLQYAQKSGTCDSGFAGESYQDVDLYTPIAFYNNFAPDSGAALITDPNDPKNSTYTTIPQTYVEDNNFTNSIAPILVGQDGQWDFSLVDKSPGNTPYCLRMVKLDGSHLNTYSVIPEVLTAMRRSFGGGSRVESTTSGTITSGGTTVGGGTIVEPKPQCSDLIDNGDGDGLIDASDPQCHANGNINNQYVPTHNSESVAPIINSGGGNKGGGGGDLGYLYDKVNGIFSLKSLRNLLVGMVYGPF